MFKRGLTMIWGVFEEVGNDLFPNILNGLRKGKMAAQ